MLDKLIEQVKSQLVPALVNDPEVDNAQAEQIAEVSGDTVVNSIMEQARSGDLSGIREMFSGSETAASSPAASQLVPRVAENLISRLGLSPQLAQTIAGKVIPLIMNMLNGKVREAQSRGIDVGGLLGRLASGSGQGGLLGKLGGLFGGAGKTDAASGNKQSDISDVLGKFFR